MEDGSARYFIDGQSLEAKIEGGAKMKRYAVVETYNNVIIHHVTASSKEEAIELVEADDFRAEFVDERFERRSIRAAVYVSPLKEDG